MAACDVNIDLHPDDANASGRVRRSADGGLVLAGRIAVPPHTTQLALENTLVSNIAAADPDVCMAASQRTTGAPSVRPGRGEVLH